MVSVLIIITGRYWWLLAYILCISQAGSGATAHAATNTSPVRLWFARLFDAAGLCLSYALRPGWSGAVYRSSPVILRSSQEILSWHYLYFPIPVQQTWVPNTLVISPDVSYSILFFGGFSEYVQPGLSFQQGRIYSFGTRAPSIIHKFITNSSGIYVLVSTLFQLSA